MLVLFAGVGIPANSVRALRGGTRTETTRVRCGTVSSCARGVLRKLQVFPANDRSDKGRKRGANRGRSGGDSSQFVGARERLRAHSDQSFGDLTRGGSGPAGEVGPGPVEKFTERFSLDNGLGGASV